MKILNNTKYLLVAFFLFAGIVSYSQATVTIEINWPSYSNENRFTFYDTLGAQIDQQCDPNKCYTKNGNGGGPGAKGSNQYSYATSFNYNIPYGNGYSILLEDVIGDGWDGTGGYIRVYVDGVLTLENDGKEVSLNGINGFYSDQLPRTLVFDITSNPTNFDTSLFVFDSFSGYYDYSSTGNTLRTQQNSPSGNACAITTASSGTLTTSIPGSASIEKAYLYWASSGINVDSDVTFDGQAVTADVTYRSYSTFNQGYFSGGVADVTTIVTASPDETFDFSGLSIDTSLQYCSVETVLGGWSLLVFYSDDSFPAVTINLYQGFSGESNSSSSFTLDSFFAIGASGSKTTVLSWEGDSTLDGNSSGSTNPEALSVTNQLGTTYTLSGDGGQTGNNAYNSTIYDNTVVPIYNDNTSYGVDLDTYDISSYIASGDSQVTVNVDSGQDFITANAVVLKVSSNLITGTVFEDMNYGGSNGRSLTVSGGAPIEGATVELYNNSGTLVETTTTGTSGKYLFGGMTNGTFSVRVVNSSVNSTRGGGTVCSTCMPIQTFRTNFASSTLTNITDEVGGTNPNGQDVIAGTLTNAQSVATVSITNEGAVDVDFGFNFNTIVNTNEDSQGSLEQFIVNSNNLDETGLDIEANAIFDPSAGEDTSIFMIPSSADPLGRTADVNFASGYFDIYVTSSAPFSPITGSNTVMDGRTQTAYSGNTNIGTVGSGGALVGTSSMALPNYDLPEIQIQKDNTGDVIRIEGSGTVVRNVSVFAKNFTGIRIDNGSAIITNSLLGVNALGINAGNTDYGVEVTGGTVVVDGNYIATNTDAGIFVNGGTSTMIQNNHIVNNGDAACNDNITIQSGSGIIIQQNLIDNAASLGIDGDGILGSVIIAENTITNSGQNGASCGGNVENSGILLDGSNSSITNNIISSNGGPGIVLAGGSTSGNLISQNSIYANGTIADALGIDLDLSNASGDGVSLNDNGDADSGPNGAINFPIISASYIYGTSVVVKGWAQPGAIIEVFLTDVNQGTATEGDNQLGFSTDYGEGQSYLGTVVEGSIDDLDAGTSSYADVDGNTDSTNLFEFSIPISPGVMIGNYITATATISNSTSEFSPFGILKVRNIITNRKITYRVDTN